MLATMSSDVLSKKKGKYINLYLLSCMGLKIDTCREHRMGVSESKVLKRMFVSKRGSNVRLEIFHNDKLNCGTTYKYIMQ
jgi:hypothetical protein